MRACMSCCCMRACRRSPAAQTAPWQAPWAHMHRGAGEALSAMLLLAGMGLAFPHACKTGRPQGQNRGSSHTCLPSVSTAGPCVCTDGDMLCGVQAPRARAHAARSPTWAMDVSSCPYVICVPTRSTACVARAQGRQRRLCNPNHKSYMIRIPTPCAAHAQGRQCCRRRRTRTSLN